MRERILQEFSYVIVREAVVHVPPVPAVRHETGVP
jgi:hypothetical protein